MPLTSTNRRLTATIVLFVALPLLVSGHEIEIGSITRIAGTPSVGSGVGISTAFDEPRGVAVDSAGTVFVADSNNNRVLEITNPFGATPLSSAVWTPIGPTAVVMDPANDDIIYGSMGTSGDVVRFTISTAGQTTLASSENDPYGLAYHEDTDVLYWAASGGFGELRRAPADGSGSAAMFVVIPSPRGVAIQQSAGRIFASGADRITRVNVPDGTGQQVVAGGVVAGNTDGVGRAAQLDDLDLCALTPDERFLFVSVRPTASAGGSIRRMHLASLMVDSVVNPLRSTAASSYLSVCSSSLSCRINAPAGLAFTRDGTTLVVAASHALFHVALTSMPDLVNPGYAAPPVFDDDFSLNWAMPGDFEALGLGTFGWAMPAGSAAVSGSVSLPFGVSISFSGGTVRESWTDTESGLGIERWPRIPGSPGSAVRHTKTQTSPTEFNVIVTTGSSPCTYVHFYAVDGDSTTRRQSIHPAGQTGHVFLSRDFSRGVYVTFQQTSSSETYKIQKNLGADAVIQLVALDRCPTRPSDVDIGRATRIAGSGVPSNTLGAPPTFSEPWGVAVDSAGRLYVGDFGNDRFLKIESPFGVAPSSELVLSATRPFNVLVDPSDDDVIYTTTSAPVTRYTISSDTELVLDPNQWTVYGVAFHEQTANLHWTSARNKLRRAPADGSGSVVDVGEDIRSPYGVAIQQSSDRIFVVGLSRVTQMELDGTRQAVIAGGGRQGYADGTGLEAQFTVLEACALTPDERFLFMSDRKNTVRRMHLATRVVHTVMNSWRRIPTSYPDGCITTLWCALNKPRGLTFTRDGSTLVIAAAHAVFYVTLLSMPDPPAPATPAVPVFDIDGSVNHNLYGDFAALDLGTFAWVTPDSGPSSLPSGTTVSAGSAVIKTWLPLDHDEPIERWPKIPQTVPPGTRALKAWTGNGAVNPVSITVATDQACVFVTLYCVDGDPDYNLRMTITPGSRPNDMVAVSQGFTRGVYVTFRQTIASETYTVERTAGPYVFANAVVIDPCTRPNCEWAVVPAPDSCAVSSLLSGFYACENMYTPFPDVDDLMTVFAGAGSSGQWAVTNGLTTGWLEYTYSTAQLADGICYQQRDSAVCDMFTSMEVLINGASVMTTTLNADILLRCYDLPEAYEVTTLRVNLELVGGAACSPGGGTMVLTYCVPPPPTQTRTGSSIATRSQSLPPSITVTSSVSRTLTRSKRTGSSSVTKATPSASPTRETPSAPSTPSISMPATRSASLSMTRAQTPTPPPAPTATNTRTTTASHLQTLSHSVSGPSPSDTVPESASLDSTESDSGASRTTTASDSVRTGTRSIAASESAAASDSEALTPSVTAVDTASRGNTESTLFGDSVSASATQYVEMPLVGAVGVSSAGDAARRATTSSAQYSPPVAAVRVSSVYLNLVRASTTAGRVDPTNTSSSSGAHTTPSGIPLADSSIVELTLVMSDESGAALRNYWRTASVHHSIAGRRQLLQQEPSELPPCDPRCTATSVLPRTMGLTAEVRGCSPNTLYVQFAPVPGAVLPPPGRLPTRGELVLGRRCLLIEPSLGQQDLRVGFELYEDRAGPPTLSAGQSEALTAGVITVSALAVVTGSPAPVAQVARSRMMLSLATCDGVLSDDIEWLSSPVDWVTMIQVPTVDNQSSDDEPYSQHAELLEGAAAHINTVVNIILFMIVCASSQFVFGIVVLLITQLVRRFSTVGDDQLPLDTPTGSEPSLLPRDPVVRRQRRSGRSRRHRQPLPRPAVLAFEALGLVRFPGMLLVPLLCVLQQLLLGTFVAFIHGRDLDGPAAIIVGVVGCAFFILIVVLVALPTAFPSLRRCRFFIDGAQGLRQYDEQRLVLGRRVLHALRLFDRGVERQQQLDRQFDRSSSSDSDGGESSSSGDSIRELQQPDDVEDLRQRRAALERSFGPYRTIRRAVTEVRRHRAESDNAPPSSCCDDVSDFVLGNGKWVTAPDLLSRGVPLTRLIGMLMIDYGSVAPWFLLVELAVTCALGLIGSIAPSTTAGCQVIAILTAVVFGLYSFALFVIRPYNVGFNGAVAKAVGVAQALSSSAFAAALFHDKESRWLADAGIGLAVATVYILLAKQAIDIVLLAGQTVERMCCRGADDEEPDTKQIDQKRTPRDDRKLVVTGMVGDRPVRALNELILAEASDDDEHDRVDVLEPLRVANRRYRTATRPADPFTFDGGDDGGPRGRRGPRHSSTHPRGASSDGSTSGASSSGSSSTTSAHRGRGQQTPKKRGAARDRMVAHQQQVELQHADWRSAPPGATRPPRPVPPGYEEVAAQQRALEQHALHRRRMLDALVGSSPPDVPPAQMASAARPSSRRTTATTSDWDWSGL